MALIGPFDFSDGLNTRAGLYVTPRSQCSTMKGFYPDYLSLKNQDNIYSLTGVNSLSGGARPVVGITYWEDPATTVSSGKIIVAVSDSKIWRAQYQESGITISFTDCTGTATVHDTAVSFYQFASLAGKLIGVGNSAQPDPPFKLSSSGGNCAALGGSPPNGECVKTLNNFLFIGGDITNATTKSTVQWSNVSDPETWPSSNSITVGFGDGDQVVAFGAIGTDLYIFKYRSIWRLSTITTSIAGGVSLGPLIKVSEFIGAFNKFCVDNLPDGTIVFLGSDARLYRLDGTTTVQLSDFPPPGPSVQNSLNPLIPTAFGTVFKYYPSRNEVILGDASSGTNLPFLAGFDYTRNAWHQYLPDSNGVWSIAVAPPTRPDTSTGLGFSLITGSGNGLVRIYNSNAVSSGTPADNIAVINYPIDPDPDGFLPRSIIFTVEIGSYVNIRLGFDGTYASSDALQISNAARSKYVVPIPWNESASGIPHRVLDIKMTCPSSNTATIYPVWLSDEILS